MLRATCPEHFPAWTTHRSAPSGRAFKLHIPGRADLDAQTAANALIEGQPEAANDLTATDRISGIAGLAGGETGEANHSNDHEAMVQRSAIVSADGVEY